MTNLVARYSNTGPDAGDGTTITGITFDGSSLVNTVCFFQGNSNLTLSYTNCNNAASGGMDIAMGTPARTSGGKFDRVNAFNSNWYGSAANLPLVGLDDWTYDSVFTDVQVNNVLSAGILNELSSNTVYNSPHVWGYPTPYLNPDYDIFMNGGNLTISQPYMDGSSLSGIFASGWNWSVTEGHADWPADTITGEQSFNSVTAGVTINNSTSDQDYNIHGFKIESGLPASRGIVLYNGTGNFFPYNSYVSENPGSSYSSGTYNFGAGCPLNFWNLCFNPYGFSSLNAPTSQTGYDNELFGSSSSDRGDNNAQVYAGGAFSGKTGSTQRRDIIFRGVIYSSATPYTLTSDGYSPNGTDLLHFGTGWDSTETMNGTCDFLMPNSSTGTTTVQSASVSIANAKWGSTAGGTVKLITSGTVTTTSTSGGAMSTTPTITPVAYPTSSPTQPALNATGPAGTEVSCAVSVNELY